MTERQRQLAAIPTPTGTEARVCEDIAKRQQMGIAKYGVTVEENKLTHRQWLEHAYQEALDFAIYLRRAMEEHDRLASWGGSVNPTKSSCERESTDGSDF